MMTNWEDEWLDFLKNFCPVKGSQVFLSAMLDPWSDQAVGHVIKKILLAGLGETLTYHPGPY